MINIFLPNKYTRWYYAIVNGSKNRISFGYVEKHHIIPKSFGGSNDVSNIAVLTAREHFICHRLLSKMTEGKNKRKMHYALWCLAKLSPANSKHKGDRKITSRTFSIIREDYSKTVSYFLKHRKQSAEHIENHAASIRGKSLSEEHKKKLSSAVKGIPFSEERKKNMKGPKPWISAQMKERHQQSNSTPIKTLIACEHCGKIMNKCNIAKYHGPKCKTLLNQ